MVRSRGPGPFSTVFEFIRDARGVTAVEYSLLAGLIALVIIGAMSAIFMGIGNQFNVIGVAL
jgi:pilus assembly protein Flp/PilA